MTFAGIIGNSVAYHLASMGMKDVVLLEQGAITSGTTWHAAGLMVTFGSLSETSTELRKYTKKLYSSLEAETGQSTGFKPVGFIELAANADRLEEYRRMYLCSHTNLICPLVQKNKFLLYLFQISVDRRSIESVALMCRKFHLMK